MIFSHGLGGSRNAYSHFAGSIASHGVVVIAPEHRDGSAPISYIRSVPETKQNGEKSSVTKTKRTVDYRKISHTPSADTEAARSEQLKIRLWELGCIHDALLKIDEGKNLTNLNTSSATFLSNFSGKMALHEPGTISFAGHSFGAATVTQFVKSTFYSSETSNAPSSYEPIFTPSSRSAISKQITPNTPLILLDCWCMPLRASTTRWLWNKPLPCYAPGGPGGSAVLAVESQAFFKWRIHLKATKRLLSSNPASDTPSPDSRPPPHFYYPVNSAHLSQSDFGTLFPWFTKRMFAVEEPERIMKLNVRATLQLLRERGINVAPTSAADMELETEDGGEMVTNDDTKIFSKDGGVRNWVHLTTDVHDMEDITLEVDSGDSGVGMGAKPSEAVVGGELMKGMQGGQGDERPRLQPRGMSSPQNYRS
jgi:platelet-activating factor acetylhydrolase